jgi:hypothetical protein
VALRGEGSRAASYSDQDQTLKVWNLENGEELATIRQLIFYRSKTAEYLKIKLTAAESETGESTASLEVPIRQKR